MGIVFSSVHRIGVHRGRAILAARSRVARSFVLWILLAALALDGAQQVARADQRTTLEVLNSLQDLTTARTNLIQAQRDRVVASYTLLAAIGRVDHKRLGLVTASYDPQTHYQQVRDAWPGLRTPSRQ